MKYYKVVTGGMRSLGLRKNPNTMKFTVGEWTYDKTELFLDNRDNGGIWVANGMGAANTLKKYMMKRYGVGCLIFSVEIGSILYQNSYRTKTDRVRLVDMVQGL